MASYFNLLQQTNSGFESPAKVFAKLKSKVQREALCAKQGVFPDKDLPCIDGEKHAADFNSPRKMTHDLKENKRFGSYGKAAQALTLSPISQKTFGYSFSGTDRTPVLKIPHVNETGHTLVSGFEHTLTKGAFLESTAVSHPISLVNGEQVHTKPAHVRDSDGFKVTGRTPVKIQPVQNDCVRSVFEEERALQNTLMSPDKVYSPMRTRLRKRKWEQGFNRVGSTKEVSTEVTSQPLERKSLAGVSDDEIHNTCIEEFSDVRGLSADRSEMSQFTHEPRFQLPRSTAVKQQFQVMSPAKMFAYMKERESKRKQEEVQEVHEVHSSTRQLFSGGNFHLSRDMPLSTAHNVDEEHTANTSVQQSGVPVKRCKAETTDKQSDSSEDVAVLLEDPLMLNSPRISVPKKHQAVFKRSKLPQCDKFPDESVIYLKQWFLRKANKGLFVDGIHRDENIPWNSNIIVERISNSVLKTVSGRVYILIGKMKLGMASGFPKWFLKKFGNGFPPNWKLLHEKLLSESRDGETEKNNKGRNSKMKKKSETSSVNISVQQERQTSFKTPISCPPASSSTNVSRSGRIIKPPLEYWKGGRVFVDAHMNVTIHECYNSPVCIPVTTTVSARKSQKPTHVFMPCSKGKDKVSSVFPGHKQCESANEEEESVPLRKVKAPLRCRAKIDSEEWPSNPPEPSAETKSSPKDRSVKTTRSSQRCPDTEKMLHLDTVPQKQRKPKAKKASTHRSTKHTHGTNRLSVRQRKQTVTASSESLAVSDQTIQRHSSDENLSIKRKTWGKVEYRKTRGNPQLSNVSPSSQSREIAEESEMKLRRRTKNSDAAKTQRKCNKTSTPTKPLAKSAQFSKKHKANKGNTVSPQEQDEDEDEWTEEELIKLQKAVSHYPKHMTGYWAKVAKMVGTRSAAECHQQHTSQGISQTPAKKDKKPKKEKEERTKDQATDHPVISARAGTFKRKQQVRQFLEAMPKEDVDDIFSSAYMQNKRFEVPSMCPSEDRDFPVLELEPLTPVSKPFPEVKTPQCLHITPGMMGSPNRNNDDKYVFQLQKRMKKNQFNVCKQAPSAKNFTPTPSVKRTIRCGNTENDTFVVWEMFPGNEGALLESGEEEDFYFSDND